MPELTSAPMILLMWAVLGYLIGSVPFGVLISNAFGLGDLRKVGSGNIGATNVLRTGNKKAAFLTLVFDGGKGVVAVLLARWFAGEDAAQIAALMAFLGHCFPVWLGFRGGKGVATFLGIVLALVWPVGVACCVTWLVTAAAFRYSSLAALLAAGLAPVWAVLLGSGSAVILLFALALLVYLRHSTNIQRLIARSEPKIGQKG